MPLPPELAKYIDDLMKADLLYWRNLWFTWAAISTAVVVAGLFGELPELVHELKSMWRRYEVRGHTISRNEPTETDWIKPVAFVGWFFIVIGVAGELGTTVMLSRADAALEAFNNASLAETNKAAGNAKASAEIAAWAAQTAQGRADVVAVSATKLARELRATAEAQKETAEAQRRTAQGLRWVTLGVNRRVVNQARCVEQLKKMGRLGTVEVWYIPDDPDASFFASGIYTCANNAGWGASNP